MTDERTKLLGFMIALVALALVVAVFGERLLTSASGPENELITWLKKKEQPGEPFDGALVGQRVSYQRLSVVLGPDGQSATVSGTLDFTGRKEGVTVSSLGFERVKFAKKDGEWRAVDGPAPRLAAVVRALERRRRALEAGDIPDAEGLDREEAERYRRLEARRFTVEAWFIRSEKEGVEVSEDFRLQGNLPDRPVDEKGSRRLSLSEDARGEFSFPRGLL
ncbi:MAG: hypothetical protein JNJ54_28375 [Myxococcaceae bacterium]|nr:hypothetical protein [Myxococcaceae bacterium]